MNQLSVNIARFCTLLREEHDFDIGQAEVHDALRACETLGVTDGSRFRTALRLVCCNKSEQMPPFERAFEAFFIEDRQGIAQATYRPRHTRPSDRESPGLQKKKSGRQERAQDVAEAEGDGGSSAERRPTGDEVDDATAWQMMRARYSPSAASAEPPRLKAENFAAMFAAATALVASVRLGRSRRWKAMERGSRFDLRRTIRASLETGGDPFDLRLLGHPARNPRFVVLVDGSRSMAEHTDAIVQFARALVLRWRRTNVFFFSTELREVTRELRDRGRTDGAFSNLGAAWGGGTKIGTSLAAFVEHYGSRFLTEQTVVLIFSDGLDVGDIPPLERALREIDRRSAALVWLNPHAASPGFVPAARGMRAALPFVSILAAANDARGFLVLARRLARAPRIRSRR